MSKKQYSVRTAAVAATERRARRSGVAVAASGSGSSYNELYGDIAGKLDKEAFDSMFERVSDGVDADGVERWYIRAKASLVSVGDLTAYGLNGSAGDGTGPGAGVTELRCLDDVILTDPKAGQILKYDGKHWINGIVDAGLDEAALAAYLATNRYAKTSDIPSLVGYATQIWVEGKGYATEAWVNAKGYLTQHQDISHLLTREEFEQMFERVENEDGSWYILAKSHLASVGDITAYGTGGPGSTLGGIGDVTLGSLAAGDVIMWDGQKWVNGQAPGGGLDEEQLAAYLTANNYITQADLANYVTALGTSGDNLTWTKNGVANSLTVPYAIAASNLYNCGHANDLNTGLSRNGLYYWTPGTANRPTNYGVVLQWSNVNSVYNGSGCWLAQLASGTEGTGLYYRTQTNGSTWGAWSRILTHDNYPAFLDQRYVNKAGDTMTGDLYAPHLLVGITQSEVLNSWPIYDNKYWHIIVAGKPAHYGGSINIMRTADSQQAYIGWIHKNQDHFGIGAASNSNEIEINNHLGGINIASTGAFTYNGNTIWHAGNDGSGSDLDADLLDGMHGSNYVGYRGTVNSISVLPATAGMYNVFAPGWYGGAVVFNCAGSNSGLAFYRPGGSNSMPQILCALDSTNNWENFGSIVTTRFGNAPSASKLQTARTIYINSYNNYRVGDGVEFDGTGDVTLKLPNSITASDWFRSYGASGWYNQDYGGGIYMSDSAWVRVYNNKGFYSGTGEIRSDSRFNRMGQYGASWNNGAGAYNVAVYNNANQTPLLHAYRDGAGADATGANRLFAMELLNSGALLRFGFGGAEKFEFHNSGYFITWGDIRSFGNILASGDVTAYSDARLKSDIRPLTNRGFITPRTYIKDGRRCIGFLAQEVQQRYPELVMDTGGADHWLSLNYGNLVAVLEAQIIDHEDRLKRLEARI